MVGSWSTVFTNEFKLLVNSVTECAIKRWGQLKEVGCWGHDLAGSFLHSLLLV